MHLSTFAKFFFPFGNFLAPLLLWTTNKEKPFVAEHGRQAINFQLSILVYTIIIGLLCLPFFAVFATDFIGLIEEIDQHSHDITFHNITNLSGYIILFSVVVLLLFSLFIFELYCVISATIKANQGINYKYPLTIPFIKINLEDVQDVPSSNQSKNEHLS